MTHVDAHPLILARYTRHGDRRSATAPPPGATAATPATGTTDRLRPDIRRPGVDGNLDTCAGGRVGDGVGRAILNVVNVVNVANIVRAAPAGSHRG